MQEIKYFAHKESCLENTIFIKPINNISVMYYNKFHIIISYSFSWLHVKETLLHIIIIVNDYKNM